MIAITKNILIINSMIAITKNILIITTHTIYYWNK